MPAYILTKSATPTVIYILEAHHLYDALLFPVASPSPAESPDPSAVFLSTGTFPRPNGRSRGYFDW